MNASQFFSRFAGPYLSFIRNLPAASFLVVVGLFMCGRAIRVERANPIAEFVVGLLCIAGGVLAWFANGYEFQNQFSNEEKKQVRVVVFVMLLMMAAMSAFIVSAIWAVPKVNPL